MDGRGAGRPGTCLENGLCDGRGHNVSGRRRVRHCCLLHGGGGYRDGHRRRAVALVVIVAIIVVVLPAPDIGPLARHTL